MVVVVVGGYCRCCCLPLEKSVVLHLNKVENLRFCQCIFDILLLSPLKKARGPSFKQTIPFTKGWFVPSLVENGPVVLEKICKFYHVYSLFRYYLPFENGI